MLTEMTFYGTLKLMELLPVLLKLMIIMVLQAVVCMLSFALVMGGALLFLFLRIVAIKTQVPFLRAPKFQPMRHIGKS